MMPQKLFSGSCKLYSSCVLLKRFKYRQTFSQSFPLIESFEVMHPSSVLQKNQNQDNNQKSSAGSLSYSLMMKHKLIQNASGGTHYYMPALTRSLEKLTRIIDREMRSVGAKKITTPCLSPHRLWDKSGRWDIMGDEMFKVKDRNGSMHCLSPTHEEAVTSIVAHESPIYYKRLPIKLYQIGKKFRDEMRPKHGLLRCKEFEMKDLYTFDATSEDASLTFEEICIAYSNILKFLDLPFMTVEASCGNMGGNKSVEFHLLSNVGEDILYKCDTCGHGVNKELLDVKDDKSQKCSISGCSGTMQKHQGIEVAHAFILGTKYSDSFGAKFIDPSGNKKPLVMGCYGIGVSRLLASSMEVRSTPEIIKYCPSLAPYQICMVPQKEGYKSEVTWEICQSLYDKLSDSTNLQYEVVIDDRLHLSIGKRVNQATATGFPYIIIIGKKALEEVDPRYEVIDVYNGSKNFFTLQELLNFAQNIPFINISL